LDTPSPNDIKIATFQIERGITTVAMPLKREEESNESRDSFDNEIMVLNNK
jgi:hypothetical protein